MRIAYAVPHADFLEPDIGGDNVLARGIMAALRARGHDVRLVSTLNPADVARGRVGLLSVAAEAARVARRMHRFRPDAWLVYSPSEGKPDLFGQWLRPRRYVLFAAHAPRGRAARHGRREAVLDRMHRRSLWRADVVTAWRPETYDKLAAAGVPARKLAMVLPAADAAGEPPSQAEARRRLGLPPDAPVALIAGRFSVSRDGRRPKKSDMMAEVIRSVPALPPDATVAVVGDGPGRAAVTAAAGPYDGRVRLPGAVEHADMRWWFAACDAYVYPARKDYVWVSVLEAQLAGRPVVMLRTRSAELSLRPGRTGLLADDMDGFRRALGSLLADRARCAEMGRAARAYALAEHTMDVRVRELERLLAP